MRILPATIFALLITAPCAYANDEYGAFEEDTESYPTYDCHCDCDNLATPPKRDNYTGVRIYKNEHAAYAYTFPNGHHDKFTKDNFGFGTVMGNRLTDFLRIEYETLYMGAQDSAANHDFEYDIWANFLNAYLFQEFSGAVAPYVGAGLGLTGIWGEVDGELDNAFDLSYQAMVGIWFDLNDRIALDLGFKYVNYGRVEHDTAVSKVDATQIYLGASYKFGM